VDFLSIVSISEFTELKFNAIVRHFTVVVVNFRQQKAATVITLLSSFHIVGVLVNMDLELVDTAEP